VAALEKIYAKPGPDTLRQTLTVLKDAWGTKVEAYDQLMIKGLAGVLQKAGAAINHKELATRLARHGTPARFIGEARQYAKLSGIGATRACSEIIVNVWNKRKQEKAQITL
jgi:hypothetical protein